MLRTETQFVKTILDQTILDQLVHGSSEFRLTEHGHFETTLSLQNQIDERKTPTAGIAFFAIVRITDD